MVTRFALTIAALYFVISLTEATAFGGRSNAMSAPTWSHNESFDSITLHVSYASDENDAFPMYTVEVYDNSQGQWVQIYGAMAPYTGTDANVLFNAPGVYIQSHQESFCLRMRLWAWVAGFPVITNEIDPSINHP